MYEVYLYACFHEIPQSPVFLLASRLCEHSGAWVYARTWVWISIVTASQLSWMLKCQPRVQALTCPHVLLSTVAATGIKHTFLARFKNRNATVVGSAVGRCLCSYNMASHWFAGVKFENTWAGFFFILYISAQLEENVECKVWRAVKDTHQLIRL